MGHPLIDSLRIQSGILIFLKDHLYIANDANWRPVSNILINLCRIDVDLKDLGIFRELTGISDYTVTESDTDNHQQVSVMPKLDVLVPCIPTIPVYCSWVPSNAPLPIRVSATGA